MDVLKKINRLRLERNWSIYRLSIESGIPQSTLSNMFNRETLPSITTLECICAAFGITMSEFFLEKNNCPFSNLDQEILTLYKEAPEEVQKSILSLLRAFPQKK